MQAQHHRRHGVDQFHPPHLKSMTTLWCSRPALKSWHAEHVFELSEAVSIVTSPTHLATVDEELSSFPQTRQRIVARTGNPPAGTMAFDELLAATGEPPNAEITPDDTAQMIFTSGATSRPKAVMLTHANYLRSGERAARSMAVEENDLSSPPCPRSTSMHSR